jgi:hypothetical protein
MSIVLVVLIVDTNLTITFALVRSHHAPERFSNVGRKYFIASSTHVSDFASRDPATDSDRVIQTTSHYPSFGWIHQ